MSGLARSHMALFPMFKKSSVIKNTFGSMAFKHQLGRLRGIRSPKQNCWVRGKAICKDFGSKFRKLVTVLPSSRRASRSSIHLPTPERPACAQFASHRPCSRIHTDGSLPATWGTAPGSPGLTLASPAHPHGGLGTAAAPTAPALQRPALG